MELDISCLILITLTIIEAIALIITTTMLCVIPEYKIHRNKHNYTYVLNMMEKSIEDFIIELNKVKESKMENYYLELAEVSNNNVLNNVEKGKALAAIMDKQKALNVNIGVERAKLPKFYYLDGNLYESPTGKTSGGQVISRDNKFKEGDKLVLMSKVNDVSVVSQEFIKVGTKVVDESNTEFVPSALTEKFHVNILGKAPSKRGMAGFSHNYWHLASDVPSENVEILPI